MDPFEVINKKIEELNAVTKEIGLDLMVIVGDRHGHHSTRISVNKPVKKTCFKLLAELSHQASKT